MNEVNFAKKKSVSIYDEDECIVNDFAEPMGLDFSSALRVIIREWKEFKTNTESTHILKKKIDPKAQ